jgi:hypothetical protein
MPIPEKLLEQIRKNDPDVTELDLKKLGLGKQDMVVLAEALKCNKIVKKLILDKNNIDDEGLDILAEVLFGTAIEIFSIADNHISATGLGDFYKKIFSAKAKLTEINLQGNCSIKAFYEHLPQGMINSSSSSSKGVHQPGYEYRPISSSHFKEEKVKYKVNRSIDDFKGHSLIIGCGQSYGHDDIHPDNLFYHIDRDAMVNPDLVYDIRQLITQEIIPDKKFNFVFFEDIDCTVFMDTMAYANGVHFCDNTFTNVKRLLTPDGICAVLTGDDMPVFQDRGTILFERFVDEGFVSGKWAPVGSQNNKGGLVLVSQQPITEKVINKLDAYAQRIVKGIWFGDTCVPEKFKHIVQQSQTSTSISSSSSSGSNGGMSF